MKRLLMPLLFGLIPAALPAAAKADGYYCGRAYDSCRYEYRGDCYRSAGAYCDRGPVVVYRYTPYDAGCYRDNCDRGYTVVRRYEDCRDDRCYDRGRVEYRYGR